MPAPAAAGAFHRAIRSQRSAFARLECADIITTRRVSSRRPIPIARPERGRGSRMRITLTRLMTPARSHGRSTLVASPPPMLRALCPQGRDVARWTHDAPSAPQRMTGGRWRDHSCDGNASAASHAAGSPPGRVHRRSTRSATPTDRAVQPRIRPAGREPMPVQCRSNRPSATHPSVRRVAGRAWRGAGSSRKAPAGKQSQRPRKM